MEVFVVESLVELWELRHLFRAFPPVLFAGNYVRPRVQVNSIDRMIHSRLFRTILPTFAAQFNCEIPPPAIAMINDIAIHAESLVTLGRMVHEAAIDLENGDLADELWYQMLGRGAQIARHSGRFANGHYADMLFVVTKEAVSCANTGQELVLTNNRSTRRWDRLTSRLLMIPSNVDILLQSPVILG